MAPTQSQAVGSMLALAMGDALGAAHEGDPVGGLMRPLTGDLRWTDDTQMALGLAESLTECEGLNADHLAGTWARDFTWDRGYGMGAARLLQAIADGADWRQANRTVFPDGSFGNGAAMRAAPIGLYYADDAEARREAAAKAAEITHAHPLGIEGGALIAEATAAALTAPPLDVDTFFDQVGEVCEHREFTDRLDHARHLDKARAAASPHQIAEELGHNILAHQSAVTAVYLAVRHREDGFETMMRTVVSVGGDVDTIGAMAGGIWGAHRGRAALPESPLARLEARNQIEAAAAQFSRAIVREEAEP